MFKATMMSVAVVMLCAGAAQAEMPECVASGYPGTYGNSVRVAMCDQWNTWGPKGACHRALDKVQQISSDEHQALREQCYGILAYREEDCLKKADLAFTRVEDINQVKFIQCKKQAD